VGLAVGSKESLFNVLNQLYASLLTQTCALRPDSGGTKRPICQALAWYKTTTSRAHAGAGLALA